MLLKVEYNEKCSQLRFPVGMFASNFCFWLNRGIIADY
jgi:hypothetical protein